MVSAVDVGFHNMGIVTLTEEGNPVFAKRVDLRNQNGNLGMRIEHALTENMDRIASHVVVERQPPGGMQDIMQLLLYIMEKSGRTVSLVNPNTLHKHFRMSSDYDMRKEQSVGIALSHGFGDLETFINEDRQHDMADAVLMALHWLHLQIQIKEQEEKRAAAARNRNLGFEEMLERFRFTPGG
jgi:hypothetical protein